MQLVKPADKTIEEIWRAGKKNWGIRWDRVKLGTICKYAHALTIWSEAVLELDGASVIVLCPWFVNVMNRQRDPRPTTVLGRIGDLLVTGLQHTPVLHGRKEIDLYAWPYTTILHEVS
jgi:hypothetical protein